MTQEVPSRSHLIITTPHNRLVMSRRHHRRVMVHRRLQKRHHQHLLEGGGLLCISLCLVPRWNATNLQRPQYRQCTHQYLKLPQCQHPKEVAQDGNNSNREDQSESEEQFHVCTAQGDVQKYIYIGPEQSLFELIITSYSGSI